MSETPSYPSLIELIGRLEGKDKAIAAKALYCLNRLDKKEVKLFNEVQILRAENEKLREALNGIISDMNGTQFPQTNVRAISVGALNAAAAAIRESSND